MRTIRRFVRLGPRSHVRPAVSWVLLGLTRMMIVAMPFSWVRRLLSAGSDRLTPLPSPSPSDEGLSHSIARSIALASTRTPWRSECYPQALTARLQLMAAGIPHTVTFGLKRGDDGELRAHAWVRAGDVCVSGGEGNDFTVVGSFPWAPRGLSEAA